MSVHYRVRVLPERHQLEVEVELKQRAVGPLTVQIPTWVPGAYGFMKYARDLFDLRATCLETGASLPLVREGFSGWRIDGARGAVRLDYTSGGFDPAWGELVGLVDHAYAILLGTRYLHVPEWKGAVHVDYALPQGWPLHHPGGAIQTGPASFTYPGYGVLLDTPVVAGAFTRRTRTLHGATFHCVFVDEAVGFERELERFVDEVMRVSEVCHALFGSFPFEDYTYVFSFDPNAHWGLEHVHATMIGLGPDGLIDAGERTAGLRTVAHELYHAWNVCRLKPRALMDPDRVAGAFPAELWVSEGFTRYYEFLLMVRAGLSEPATFFSNLVNYLNALVQLPAWKRVSPADSSRATFLNHNRYAGAANATIDYYDVGMLMAFDLDATLRTLPSPRTLDADFRDFYAAHVEQGFTQEELVAFFEARAPAAAARLARQMNTPGSLDTEALLARLGFEPRRRAAPRLGLILAKDQGPVIADVLDTLPAGNSGLAAGDELLLVQGHPFTKKRLLWCVAQGAPVTLQVRRGHRVLDFTVAPTGHSRIEELLWQGDEVQLQRLQSWIARPDFAPARGEAIPLTSHENFHGVQTLV